MAYNIGALRQKIAIDAPVWSVDLEGRRTRTWQHRIEGLAAQARDVSGREFYEAAAHKLQDVVTFTIRFYAVEPGDSILWNNERYRIMEINHLGYRGDFLSIKARSWRPSDGE